MKYLTTIILSTYLQKLAETKILFSFFFFSILGWTKLRGKVVRIEENRNQQRETEIESRSRKFARIHRRCKNRVNNEKQATATWFNDTVEIWSSLIKSFLNQFWLNSSFVAILFISQNLYTNYYNLTIDILDRDWIMRTTDFFHKSFREISTFEMTVSQASSLSFTYAFTSNISCHFSQFCISNKYWYPSRFSSVFAVNRTCYFFCYWYDFAIFDGFVHSEFFSLF